MTNNKGIGRKGKVVQVLGAVIDVEFAKEAGLPAIYDAQLIQP
jgi:F0F1-type ATP synthase beta subunit